MKFYFTCFCLFIFCFNEVSASQHFLFPKPKKPKPNFNRLVNATGQRFIILRAGLGLWYQSHQPGMMSHQNPWDVQLEYGSGGGPLSYIGGYNFHTTFAQDIYLLKPSMAYLGLKYTPSLPKLPQWINPYLAGGLAAWQTILTDENYDGIINYQHKVEKDQGIAGFIQAGVDFNYRKFVFGPQVTTFIAQNGSYLAGTFEKQAINPGYYYLGIHLGYRFSLKRTGRIACPSYY
ncbi:MAG: hypothetical protein ACNS62_02060 [Candidatus Cyclobacteriaceae bacterium M3_2C_046]